MLRFLIVLVWSRVRALLGLRRAILKACETPFGKLPDSVLLHILRDGCDVYAQQAAYQSCRDIRDFCNRHMKSVTVEIHTAGSLQAVKERSSRTMCPAGACSIEQLTLCLVNCSSSGSEKVSELCECQAQFSCLACSKRLNCAFEYLKQLIHVTFMPHGTHTRSRRKQLANISSIKFDLMLNNCDRPAYENQLLLSHFVSQFPKLEKLHTNSNLPLPGMVAPQLRQLVCEQRWDAYRITPLKLRWLSNKNPNIQKLWFFVTSRRDSNLEACQPELLRFKALTHLSVHSAYISLLPAGLLLPLTSLVTLELNGFEVQDTHLLTQLHITHLILGCVCVQPTSQQQQQQQQPVKWPALKSIQFVDYAHPVQGFTETMARALFPLSHPGFTVEWMTREMEYVADLPPDPRYGYMGVAHMWSVDEVRIHGEHVQALLRAMVKNQIHVSHLSVRRKSDWNNYNTPTLQLGIDDIDAVLSFPAVTYMDLEMLETGTPEMYRKIFQKCPMLRNLRLPFVSVPQDAEMETYLSPLGVEWKFPGGGLTMTRSNKRSA